MWPTVVGEGGRGRKWAKVVRKFVACMGVLAAVVGVPQPSAAQVDGEGSIVLVDHWEGLSPVISSVASIDGEGRVGAELSPDAYSIHTSPDGLPVLGVPAGCWAITIGSNLAGSFIQDPLADPWAVCVTSGETVEYSVGRTFSESGPRPRFVGWVRTPEGEPVAGARIDFYNGADEPYFVGDAIATFLALDSDQARDVRGAFRRTVVTGADGFINGESTSGPAEYCQVATITAPDGYHFSTGPVRSVPLCAGNPSYFSHVVYPIDQPAPEPAKITLAVGSSRVLYWLEVRPDGWTDTFNNYGGLAMGDDDQSTFELPPGCSQLRWVLRNDPAVSSDFPTVFTETATKGLQQRVCVDPGQRVTLGLPDHRLADHSGAPDAFDPTQPVLVGRVVDRAGAPVAGIEVSVAWPDGPAIATLHTGDDGRWRHGVVDRCWTVTYSASNGLSFAGSPTHATVLCQGDAIVDVVADRDGDPPASINSSVVDQTGHGVPDVTISYFAPAAGVTDETILTASHRYADYRGDYMGKVTTATSGSFAFEPTTNCVVAVYKVPQGYTSDSGQFVRQGACADAPLPVVTLTKVASATATIGGTMTSTSSAADTGKVNLFAGSPGGAWDYIGVAYPDGVGAYTFSDLRSSCYALDGVTPEGTVFKETGTRYLRTVVCVEAGQSAAGPTGTIIDG